MKKQENLSLESRMEIVSGLLNLHRQGKLRLYVDDERIRVSPPSAWWLEPCLRLITWSEAIAIVDQGDLVKGITARRPNSPDPGRRPSAAQRANLNEDRKRA